MDTSPNLLLPYIMAAQSQKHVTHNEALRSLDALVQIAVSDRSLSSPPASPNNGERWIIATAASGAWAGQDNKIAAYQDGAWSFYAPREGYLVWVCDEDKLVTWSGSAWIAVGIDPEAGLQNVGLLGINAAADTTNRLTLASPAALFNHAGSGHQLKINKSSASATASLMFQTGFSGRAEMGTTGDDKWHLKMSADGASWTEAFVVTPDAKIGFGTADPGGLGGDIVLNKSVNAPLIAKVANAKLGSSTQARFDLSIGYPNAYALLGISDAGGAPICFFNGGTGITGCYFDWSEISFRTPSGVERLRVEASGHTRPGADNAYTLGTASARWSTIYAANGTINTSDARDKTVVGSLSDIAGALIDAVEPVLFRWNVGGNEIVEDGTETALDLQSGEECERPRMVTKQRPGRRIHAGFLAQDVRAAMEGAKIDFRAWGLDEKDDPESRQWLRSEQLLPVLWQAVRELRAEVSRLGTLSDTGTK